MNSGVVIYSTRSCAYCVRAKAYFKHHDIPFEEVDLTEKPHEIDALKKKTGHATVPLIFVDGVFIGGYTDMVAQIDAGKLKIKK